MTVKHNPEAVRNDKAEPKQPGCSLPAAKEAWSSPTNFVKSYQITTQNLDSRLAILRYVVPETPFENGFCRQLATHHYRTPPWLPSCHLATTGFQSFGGRLGVVMTPNHCASSGLEAFKGEGPFHLKASKANLTAISGDGT